MYFIDTHSHIYAEEFDNDRTEAIARCFESSVEKLILPDIDASSRQAMLNLAASDPSHFFPCAGLHPTSVDNDYKTALNQVETMLASNQHFYAIGEIGIDLYWDQTFEREQFESFTIQVQWAKELGLPIIVHIRNAIEKTIANEDPFPVLLDWYRQNFYNPNYGQNVVNYYNPEHHIPENYLPLILNI